MARGKLISMGSTGSYFQIESNEIDRVLNGFYLKSRDAIAGNEGDYYDFSISAPDTAGNRFAIDVRPIQLQEQNYLSKDY